MRILFHRNFQKFVHKLNNKQLVKLIQSHVDAIIEDPTQGKLLDQPFRQHKVRTLGFSHKKNSFRIAFILNNDELVFLLIDSRENFYKKLEQMF